MNTHIIDTIGDSTKNIAEKLMDALPKRVLNITSDKELVKKQIGKLIEIKLRNQNIDSLLVKKGEMQLSIKIGSPLNALVSESPADRDNVEDVIVKKVGRLIYFFKKTAFPAIKKQILVVKDAVENSSINTELDKLKIRYLTIPKFAIEITKTMPEFTGFNSSAIFGRNYNADYFNTDKTGFLDTIDRKTLEKVWAIISDISNKKDTSILENKENDPGYLFIAYALMNTLRKEPIPGSIGNVNKYEKLRIEMMSFLEKRVIATRDRYFADIERKNLIVRKFKHTLVVNNDVASMYFRDNAIEPLLGVLLIDKYASNMSWVIDNKDKLMEQYQNAKMQDNIIKKNAIKEIYVDAYIKTMPTLLNMLSCCLSKERDVLIKDCSHHFKDQSDIKLLDIKQSIEGVVGEHIIPQTGIEKFLKDIELYQTQTPSLTIEEVVGLTTMDMVVDILLEGVVVQ